MSDNLNNLTIRGDVEMTNNSKDLELFKEELEYLINKHSIDNFCNIPDFILSKNIIAHIKSLKNTLQKVQEFID